MFTDYSQRIQYIEKNPCITSDGYVSRKEVSAKTSQINNSRNQTFLKKNLFKENLIHSDIEGSPGSNSENEPQQKNVETDIKNGEECKVVKLKARWHSFEKKTFPKQFHGTPCISELTAAEMTQIKSVITLRLNNMMSNNGKIASGGSKRVSNIFRRLFHHESKNKIQKYSLEWNIQRFGCSFPPFIGFVLEKIGREGCSEPGIFRKCGKKSNLNELEKMMYSERTNIDLSKYTLYDLADLLKIFIRKLPDPIITSNISSLLASIQAIPPEKHLLICQSALLLMPDENREALYQIMYCLKKIANNSDINLMTAYNIAICLVPSIYQLNHQMKDDSSWTNSCNLPRFSCYNSSEAASNALDLGNVASFYALSHKTFSFLIDKFDQIFTIPYEIHTLSRITTLHNATPMCLDLLGSNENDGFKGNYESYMNINIDEFYLEHRNKYKAWNNFCSLNGVQIFSRKVKDGYPLFLYRGYIDLDVRASEVFICYLYKGSLWNGNTERFVIKNLSSKSDIFYQKYSISSDDFFNRDFTLLRQWRNFNGTYILSCTSIKICEKDLINCNLQVQHHKKIIGNNSHPRGIILGSRFVVEPMHSKSRVNLILRIDLKGRRASSYKHITPYIISQELNSLKEYFSMPPSQSNTLEEAIV